MVSIYLSAKTSIQWGKCGLSGEVRVNATFPDGTSCNGRLGDWKETICHDRPKLTLEMPHCRHRRTQGNVKVH